MTTEERPSSTCTRPLRRDAQRNRDALLTAAREAFAEQGLEAPLEQVAKGAGVAIGTLYRHFPTRLDLVQEIFAEKLQAWLMATERAAAMDDAWEGFCLYLETTCELQADDRGFNDLTSMRLPLSVCLEGTQNRILELGVRIVERAQEQGAVRADITHQDITHQDIAFVIWSHSRVTEATQGIAPRAWRRHLYLLLDAFRADRAHPLPEPPLTHDELYRAMLRLGGSAACAGSPRGTSPLTRQPDEAPPRP